MRICQKLKFFFAQKVEEHAFLELLDDFEFFFFWSKFFKNFKFFSNFDFFFKKKSSYDFKIRNVSQ